MEATRVPQSPGQDLLLGAKAIGDYLGVTKRQALYLCEKGSIPHFHDTRTLCARKSSLTAWLNAKEAAAGQADRAEALEPAPAG